MDKQKIIDYVLDTPTNTNPIILGHMLDEYGADGGGGSSPFRAVTVEITNEYGDEAFIMAGAIYDAEENATISHVNLPTDDTSVTYNIIIDDSGVVEIHKFFFSGTKVVINFDGDAELVTKTEYSGTYKITGSCRFRIIREMA